MISLAIVCLFLNVVRTFSDEDGFSELQYLRRVVHKLEKNYKDQNIEMKNMRKIVITQKKELEDMKLEIEVLNKKCKIGSNNSDTMEGNSSTRMLDNSSLKGNRQSINGMIRKGRLLTQSTDAQTVAFYAYLSSPTSGIGVHQQLVFDVVKTNIGGGYHPTGVFIVPESGVYVFTWSFRVLSNSYHTEELIVNGKVEGAAHARVSTHEQDQTSATIVISVMKGDDVSLRTGDNFNQGEIYSDPYGYAYFAGWRIR